MKIKKLVAMFLTLALAVSMVACMTSCGSKGTGKKEWDKSVTVQVGPNPEILDPALGRGRPARRRQYSSA